MHLIPVANSPILLEMETDTTTPGCVLARFITQSEIVTWALARELLVAGLVDEAGLGDVVVRPFGSDIILRLQESSTNKWFAYVLDRLAVVEFLEATATEDDLTAMDVDGCINRMLDD